MVCGMLLLLNFSNYFRHDLLTLNNAQMASLFAFEPHFQLIFSLLCFFSLFILSSSLLFALLEYFFLYWCWMLSERNDCDATMGNILVWKINGTNRSSAIRLCFMLMKRKNNRTANRVTSTVWLLAVGCFGRWTTNVRLRLRNAHCTEFK